MRKIIVLGLGIVLIAAACNKTPAADNSSQTNTSGQTGSSQNNTSNNNQGNQVLSGTVEVSMTATGFIPANVNVKKGTVVLFKNTDSKPKWPASAPHPTHTDLPGFDPLRGIGTGETYSFTFDKVGKWKYHDHLNPTKFGSVTVVEQ